MRRRTEIALTTLGLGMAIGFAVAIAVGASATEDLPPDLEVEEETAEVAEPAPTPRVEDPARRTPVVNAVELVAPTVVTITTKTPAQDLFARFQGRTVKGGSGSGVVIDPSGIILTNAHVVARASRIDVTFADGTQAIASILGVAQDLDLAVLRAQGVKDLPAVEIGTTADLMLGEPVIAIGNPFDLGLTVTTGVVSATSRSIATDTRVFQDFIQTDASINPGNSGGPLVNANGKLIGINNMIQRDSEGIGFAIPVDRAIKAAKDLVETGVVQIPWLGVTLNDVEIRAQPGQHHAAQVQRVIPNGPADAAGLIPGDLILQIDAHPVLGRLDLNTYLSGLSEVDTLQIEVLRDSALQTFTLSPGSVSDAAIDEVLRMRLGVKFKENSTPYGVLLQVAQTYPRGAFARYGLRPGDICHEVNGVRMGSIEDLRQVIRQALSRHRPQARFFMRRGPSRAGGMSMAL
jgi:S1-C subfamily serine protease